MIETMERRAHAKINWMLRVTGRRPDGYHDLETIFQTISLHDTLRFAPAKGLSLQCDQPGIPSDESNLVMRAARALGADDVAIHLSKRIPSGGGLGGGSSDAATTLLALAAEGVSHERLQAIALDLGSDVPFFLMGGTAYATGRGERLRAMKPATGVPLLLVLPEVRMATARAFGLLRQYSVPVGWERASTLLAEGPWTADAGMINDFEEPVFAELPQLRSWKERLYQCGATFAAMSGSGSTLFGGFASAVERDAAETQFPDVSVERAETI